VQFRIFWLRPIIAGAFCLTLSQSGFGQIPISNIPNQFQQAIQGQQNQLTAGQLQTLTPNVEIYQPVVPEQRPAAPTSRLEGLYNSRLPSPPVQGQSPQNSNGQTTVAQSSTPLVQFGYDIFGVPAPFSSIQLGAPQDGYILGPGDELVVVLRGPQDQTYTERVNRDGEIILPKLTPIQASGRSLGDFRADLERRVAQTYISTNAFISLGEIRQISVLITGDVRSPGTRVLSALATPLDAILLSGGIAKTGSLRNISLVRGNQTRTIDLYSIITQGDAVALGTLQNGDRIFVPPLQNTVAVAGLVRHPGIYELKNEETSVDANALIRLAGGFEIAGAYRLSKISLQPDGSTRLEPLPNGGTIGNGEILSVDNVRDVRTETVALRGAVKLPNAYPLSTTSSVRQLIRSASDLMPDAYTAFALIARRDQALNVKIMEPFSLSRVLSGQQDVNLQNEDIVYVFTNKQVRDFANGVAQQAGGGTTTLPTTVAGNATTLGASNMSAAVPDTRLAAAGLQNDQSMQNGQPGQGAQNGQTGQAQNGQFPQNSANAQNGFIAGAQSQNGGNVAGLPGTQGASPLQPTVASVALAQATSAINRENRAGGTGVATDVATGLGVSEQFLTSTFKEHLVWLYDEVKDPGAYFAAQGTNLGELVQMAGGPLRTADLSAVEVTSTTIDVGTGTSRTIRTEYKGTLEDFKRVTLQPLDVVRFRPVFSDRDQGLVTITGEVRYPGTFDVRRGERLSSVIGRAGGLTDQAYPLGAVFTRRSAAIAESEANSREARELESALATAIQRGSLTSNLSQPALISTAGSPTQGSSSDVINNLVFELRTTPALGRITVTADPAVLQVRPELDIIMEGGDTLYIPKRPSTVTVTGEVLNTGSFAYRNDFSVQDYIDMAGGTRQSADDGRTFIIMPDGSARPAEENWLSFNHTNIVPPGSTIVVPREVAPFNFFATFGNLTQITSQLAITAAALAIIHP